MTKLKRCICRIEPQPPAESLGGFGTGFLIGNDVLLTNHHVRRGFKDPKKVILRFDYETDNKGIETHAGRLCHLKDSEWLLAESEDDELDFALLRLSELVGSDDCGNSKRGFIVPSTTPTATGDPLLIVQHPNAEPLKISIGSVHEPIVSDRYIRYTANTKGGSSGSPCMNMRWETIAIHHFGAQTSNRGVLWSVIANNLRQNGKLDLIG